MAKRLFWIVIVLGMVVFRFYFALQYYHVDIWSNAGWGQWVAENGTRGFFYNNVWVYSWPTQLPLVNLIYGFCFHLSKHLLANLTHLGIILQRFHFWGAVNYNDYVKFLSSPISSEIPFTHAFILSIKLLPILADFAVAGVIWRLTQKEKTDRKWLPAVIYLASPFSWYISAFWGQYDQLSFLLLLLGFVTIDRLRWLSPVCMSLSLGIKPTSAIFIPFYLFLIWKNRNHWMQYLFGVLMGAGINLYWIQMFSQEKSLWDFISHRLTLAVIYKSEPRVTVNSYNLWYLFLGDKAANPRELFLFMPFQIWGMLGVFLVNLWGLKLYFWDKKNLWLSLAIIGVGSWVIGMNMLERYLFAGIVFGLIATAYSSWFKKPWWILSVVFWINLYKSWWQPGLFGFLQIVHERWPLIPQLLFPTINLLACIYIAKKLAKAAKKQKLLLT